MMIERILKFINERNLCQKDDNILVTVSGGVDSVVLLDLLYRNNYKLSVAHCNFNLRGEESDADEQLVKKISEKHDIPFFVKKFNTKEFAREHQISTQMAARELRYQWFEDLRQQESFDCIATAHHLNDSVETILFNLAKGTGIEGLKGIPYQNGYVIRPLLFADKTEIIDYAKEKSLEFREDSSNKLLKYHRNFIRRNIIPRLEEINPSFNKTIGKTLMRIEGTDRFIKNWLKIEKQNYFNRKGADIFIEKAFIRDNNEPVILHEIIKPYGFSFDQSLLIFNQLDNRAGALFHSNEFILNIDRDHLIISEKKQDENFYFIQKEDKVIQADGITLKLEVREREKIDINYIKGCEFFDLKKISYPLLLRPWNEGDWFIPLGMKGKKKLSDFMIDKKIPLNLKNRIMVLVSGESILWIVGYQIDDRFKIQNSTREVLKINLLENDNESI